VTAENSSSTLDVSSIVPPTSISSSTFTLLWLRHHLDVEIAGVGAVDRMVSSGRFSCPSRANFATAAARS
jgi:hypothetical protein